MRTRKPTLAAAGLLLVPLAGLAWTAAAPPGPTVTVNYGDPTTGGESTTSFRIEYIDDQGAKQDKKIEAKVSIDGTETPEEKREKVQDELDDELSDPANQVGGKALASTSGISEQLSIAPSGDDPGGDFSDVEIENLQAKDSHTGEKDETWDGEGSPSLMLFRVRGNVTGLDPSGGASTLGVHTNAGSATIALSGSMRWIDLFDQLAEALRNDCGAVVWENVEARSLYVLIDKSAIDRAAIGCTDKGLTVSAMLMSSQ